MAALVAAGASRVFIPVSRTAHGQGHCVLADLTNTTAIPFSMARCARARRATGTVPVPEPDSDERIQQTLRLMGQPPTHGLRRR